MTTETELAEYAERVHMEAELNEWIEHTVIKASLGQMTQSEEDVMNDIFLEHFGVKGQKWGVRKARGDRSSFRDRAKAKKLGDLPDIKKMSDADLRAAVSRLQLEKQFRELSKPPSNTFKAHGSKFAKDVLIQVGKEHAKKALIAAPGAIASVAMGAFVAKKMLD